MRLNADLISNYLKFLFPNSSENEHHSSVKKWLQQVEQGVRSLENYFVQCGSEEEIKAAVHIHKFHETTYAIQMPSRVLEDTSVAANDVTRLIGEAVERLQELRIPRGEF